MNPPDRYPPVIPGFPHLLHGGDYYPEQWPREIWEEDLRLMDLARCNALTVGVFSWASLEPEEGVYEFGWLDDVMNMLAERRKAVILATPSAAPPAWLSGRYPETLRVGDDLVRRRHGNRMNFCWTSPDYRLKVRAIATELAKRYGPHPALGMWHVSNEYGGECYCDLCAEAFRVWLQSKFEGDLDKLNAAYWTKFWSHTYAKWEQVEPPSKVYGETSIMGLTVDWRRFTTHQIIDFFENEAGNLRRLAPETPITTNMMGTYQGVDYWKFAQHIDVASWDSYPGFLDNPMGVGDWVTASFKHDICRSLKKGRPFLMIESTPGSSNWYPVMGLKRPGTHVLEGVQALAHGSDTVQYFQWRQSRGSGEQFHGAVVQHDGSPNTRVFKDVQSLGELMATLDDLVGTTVAPEVAVIYDWENSWAIDVSNGPRQRGKQYEKTCVDHYAPFWNLGIPVDVIDSDQEFSTYKIVVAPMLFMVKPGVAERLERFVENGGTFIATYWSGITDVNVQCFQGGFPGPLKTLLGIWSEEIDALHDGHRVWIEALEGNALGLRGRYEASMLCERIHANGADTIASYASEFYAGSPAVTCNSLGSGEAYYFASRNDATFLAELTRLICMRSGVRPVLNVQTPDGVTVQMRTDGRKDTLFVLNVTNEPRAIELGSMGLNTLDGSGAPESLTLPPYGVQILTRVSAIAGQAVGQA